MLRLVVFLALFAGVVYATFWLLDQRTKRRRGHGGSAPLKRRPVGPDDDEDFLRELERRRRHERRQRQTGPSTGQTPRKDEPPASGPPASQQPGPDAAQKRPAEEPVNGEAAQDEES